MLTHAYLKQILDYNQKTGHFTWIKAMRPRGKVGEIAGCLNVHGYIQIGIHGKRYTGHRLAWFFVHGEWPEEIDHINQDRSDNRLRNLRNVSHSENLRNQKRHKSNKSGVMGVTWQKSKSKWRVRAGKVDGGMHDDLLTAVSVRKRLEREQGYHPNHGK